MLHRTALIKLNGSIPRSPAVLIIAPIATYFITTTLTVRTGITHTSTPIVVKPLRIDKHPPKATANDDSLHLVLNANPHLETVRRRINCGPVHLAQPHVDVPVTVLCVYVKGGVGSGVVWACTGGNKKQSEGGRRSTLLSLFRRSSLLPVKKAGIGQVSVSIGNAYPNLT